VAFRIKLQLADKKSGDAPWGIAKFREETSKKAARLSSAADAEYVMERSSPQAEIVHRTKKILAPIGPRAQKKWRRPEGHRQV
jgi:hypothetical protein